jgi:hypothetical protein
VVCLGHLSDFVKILCSPPTGVGCSVWEPYHFNLKIKFVSKLTWDWVLVLISKGSSSHLQNQKQIWRQLENYNGFGSIPKTKSCTHGVASSKVFGGNSPQVSLEVVCLDLSPRYLFIFFKKIDTMYHTTPPGGYLRYLLRVPQVPPLSFSPSLTPRA